MKTSRIWNRALKRNSPTKFERALEKMSKYDETFFTDYLKYSQLSELQKTYYYYRLVLERTDLKPKYRKIAWEKINGKDSSC